MSDDNDHGHGSSPAAWTTVIIMMIGVTAGTWFFWLDMPALVWLSATSLIIGPVVGTIMAKAGYGVGGSKNSVSH
jgi:multisubunit Na+/H+ antiporter MnhG subunit